MYEKEVGAGCAYLDKQHPGWWKGINLETLNLAECNNCVLGQVAGAMTATLGMCYSYPLMVSRGFAAPMDYGQLTGEWKGSILARRKAEALTQEASRSYAVPIGSIVAVLLAVILPVVCH